MPSSASAGAERRVDQPGVYLGEQQRYGRLISELQMNSQGREALGRGPMRARRLTPSRTPMMKSNAISLMTA